MTKLIEKVDLNFDKIWFENFYMVEKSFLNLQFQQPNFGSPKEATCQVIK